MYYDTLVDSKLKHGRLRSLSVIPYDKHLSFLYLTLNLCNLVRHFRHVITVDFYKSLNWMLQEKKIQVLQWIEIFKKCPPFKWAYERTQTLESQISLVPSLLNAEFKFQIFLVMSITNFRWGIFCFCFFVWWWMKLLETVLK